MLSKDLTYNEYQLSRDEDVAHLIIAVQGGEAGGALKMDHLDELSTEIGVHGRDQTSGLNAVLDDSCNQSSCLRIYDNSEQRFLREVKSHLLCANQCCFSRASRLMVNARAAV